VRGVSIGGAGHRTISAPVKGGTFVLPGVGLNDGPDRWTINGNRADGRTLAELPIDL
jgi:hypothetical protein